MQVANMITPILDLCLIYSVESISWDSAKTNRWLHYCYSLVCWGCYKIANFDSLADHKAKSIVQVCCLVNFPDYATDYPQWTVHLHRYWKYARFHCHCCCYYYYYYFLDWSHLCLCWKLLSWWIELDKRKSLLGARLLVSGSLTQLSAVLLFVYL